MKTIISYLMLFAILTLPFQNSFGQKKSKKERKLEEFAKTTKIIKDKQFRFIPDRAFPVRGRSIDLTTNYGYIDIKGEETKGEMPFFGRGYSVPYGGDGGIRFENNIEDESLEINEKKMRILYRYEVRGENDTYQINMEIFYNGNASVSIISNNRSQISYNGDISLLEKDK